MPALTVSGNEITDASRAAATQGDGLSADSSFGVWEATTNLVTNGGFETNATGWNAVSAIIARITSQFKFGAASGEIVTSNLAANEGAYHNFTATAAVYTVSAWVRGAAGGTVRMAVRDNAGGAAQTGAAVTLTSSWQRITLTTTALTAATWRCYVETDVQQAITFQIDGVQAELQPLATPYVHTDGATATRAAARVQAPSSLITEAQGWAAVRLRMGWPSSSLPHATPMAFEWMNSTAPANQFSLFRNNATNWRAGFFRNGTLTVTDVAAAHAAGDFVTAIIAWTNTTVHLSINGGAFTSVARGGTVGGSALPSTFEIGNRATLGLEIDSDVRWFACGTGTLTSADAARIHAYGNTDKAPEDFIASASASACTATWAADTSAYLDEAFTIIDPKGDGTSKGLLPHLRVDIDFDTDPTVTPRTYENVTTDVRELSYVRSGRNHELQRTEAGTLDATLNNRHGRYDPTNATSPYYPGVKRMRWMRVRARWGVTDYTRWTGLIETWRQTWPSAGKDATVHIRAVDAFKVLNLYDLQGKSYVSQMTDERVAAVLADVGITDYTVDANAATNVVASGVFAEGSPALSHLLQIEETENGLLFAEGDGKIIFQGRHWRLLNSGTSVGTIGDQAGEIRYRTGDLDLDDADIWNEVSVTPSGGTAETKSDATSTAAHYKRRLNRSILSSSQIEAASAAEYLVGRYKDPSPRVPLVELVGALDTSTWDKILSAGNSDRFVWKRRASANTITQDVFVERVADRIVPGTTWSVALQLSPADDQSGWVLGDATYGILGETTVLAY